MLKILDKKVFKDIPKKEQDVFIKIGANQMKDLFQDEEAYEKCAIIKNRMDEVNKILKKGNKWWERNQC